MNLKQVSKLLQAIFKSEEEHSVMLLGPPGIGKTAVVSQAAKQAALEQITMALPTCEAVDLRGMPTVVNGQTRWASPLPNTGRGVLLLDELSSAPPDVQVAAHHILRRERNSDVTLPAGWHVVATGNRSEDRATYHALSAPLRNRLIMVTVELDHPAWYEWAECARIAAEVVGFLRWRPALLSASEIPADGPFTSPRSWEDASRILALNLDRVTEELALVGKVGHAAQREFSDYVMQYRNLPSARAILQAPDKAEIPASLSTMYAIITALARIVKDENDTLEDAMRYIARVPRAEYGALFITEIRESVDLKTSPSALAWIKKHKELYRS